ncbi:uncharacterized protein TNCV_4749641 [Trichonephila clavipes]|nr:uncharacterized protein TNCV_4749641 [Trichonephila clavipes]
MPPNTLRVHTEYVLVKLVGPIVLWDESRRQGTGEYFSPLQSHSKIVEVEIGGVAIYHLFGKFRRANSYCHITIFLSNNGSNLSRYELETTLEELGSHTDPRHFNNIPRPTNILEWDHMIKHRSQRHSRRIEVKVGITFQDCNRFNSCQVIYSQFGLAIHQNDHQARRRFVEWAQNEIAVVPDFHKRILFSDETHFWLNGYVNKQNCRIWSEANPQVYVETPLHPEKLTVW